MHLLKRMIQMEVFIYTGLSLIIPWLIYRINQKLHELGDPPWKKQKE